MRLTRDLIHRTTQAHTRWREQSLNLIASENLLSPAVRAALDNDWVQRYGDYVGRDLSNRKYRGNRYLEELEKGVADLAGELFGASEVELRAISGHVAGMAVIAGLTRPGDVVLEVGSDGGGHRLASKLAQAPLVQLEVEFLPFDPGCFNISVPRTLELIAKTRPRLVILGSSTFLFPHPVREIAAALETIPDSFLAYDASHVFGLIAGQRFQDPLREGAHVVFGSTHKTLPGPQGGLILSNDSQVMNQISDALYPPIVTNHHPHRIPALGLCLLDACESGRAYADQIVANAQALGGALQARGVPVVACGGVVSESHTLLLQVRSFGSGSEVANRLEEANIMTTPARLPSALGDEGIRVGVQELTRLGMRQLEMDAVAELLAAALTHQRPVQEIAQEVRVLRDRFQDVHYTSMPS